MALRILGEEGIVLDAPSFTAGITAFGQSKSWQEACRLFASMPEAKIQQDRGATLKNDPSPFPLQRLRESSKQSGST